MLFNYIRNINNINSLFETGIGRLIFEIFNVFIYMLLKYVELLSLVICIYTILLIIISFRKKGKAYSEHKPKLRFLILIPAHNEENVIQNIVTNIQNDINYPQDLLDIYVIADNCTDNTVNICKKLGINFLEHKSMPGEPVGKPYGIKYALDKLRYKMNSVDFITIFDADNVVCENFFREINSQILSDPEIKVVQGYLDCKNIDESYISLGYSLSYYLTNRFFCYSRGMIGLSPVIGGTGFAMSVDVIDKIGWNVTSLTEDLELQMQCVLNNYKIVWNHYAFVYDEKPTKVKQSFIQRFRWARGHWTVKKKYFRPLIAKFFRELIINKKIYLSSLDSALYTISPLVSAMTPIFLIYRLLRFRNFPEIFISIVAILLVSNIYTLLSLYAMKNDSKVKSKSNIFQMMYGSLWYVLTGMIIYGLGILTYNKNVWVRTEHTSNKKINDILIKEI